MECRQNDGSARVCVCSRAAAHKTIYAHIRTMEWRPRAEIYVYICLFDALIVRDGFVVCTQNMRARACLVG